MVEIDQPDEFDFFTSGTGSATWTVKAGDVFQVQIATHINPGDPAQSFVVRAVIVPSP